MSANWRKQNESAQNKTRDTSARCRALQNQLTRMSNKLIQERDNTGELLRTSGASRRWRASNVRFDPSPSISGASTRLFAGRLLRGVRALRAIHFQEAYVFVPVQRDEPEGPFETSSVGLDLGFDPDQEVYTTSRICRWESGKPRTDLRLHM